MTRVLFVALNPSTATEEINDPTVSRCMNYAARWGATDVHNPETWGAEFSECQRYRYWLQRGTLMVCNLFARRSTDPNGLLLGVDPIGPDNDRHIVTQAATSDLVVCAWGSQPAPKRLRVLVEARAVIVRAKLERVAKLHALAFTDGGTPRHPLYLKGDLEPVPWSREVAA